MNATTTREAVGFTTGAEISGTHLQGEIVATRGELLATFGAPQYEYADPNEKITYEWALTFDGGKVATVYDWKRYSDEELGLSEVYEWHIGGHDVAAVELVTAAVENNRRKITRSVFIEGRLWFDKVNGNTYFSARVWVDGRIVSVLPMQYGYDNQFLYAANDELVSLGYLPQDMKGRPIWISTREALGVDLYYSSAYVTKRELFKAGN